MKIRKYIALLLALLLMLSATGCKKETDKTKNTKKNSVATQSKSPSQNISKPQPSQNNNTNNPPKPSVNTQPSENTEVPEPTESVSLCEHVLDPNWKVDKLATCTTEGHRYRECTVCMEAVEEEVIPKLDHVKGSWVTEKKSTCTEEGRQSQSCLQCKTKLLIANIAKLDHKPDVTGKRCSVCYEFIEATP